MDKKKRQRIKYEQKQILIYLYEHFDHDNKKVNDEMFARQIKVSTQDMIKSNLENKYNERDYFAVHDNSFKKYVKQYGLEEYELIGKHTS